MRRIQFDRCGDPEAVLYLAEVTEPEPGPGEVRLRITLRPVNPSDIAYIRGLYVPPEAFPAATGLEAVGIIEAVGKGVTDIKVGDRYMIARQRGTWADKMIVPALSIEHVPAEISDEIACQVHANPLTAWLMLQGVTKPGAIVQTAAGSAVGRLVDQLGKIQGRRVINIVRNQITADDLYNQGATHVVISSQPDWLNQIQQAAGPEPIIAAFDPVAGQTGLDLLSVLAPGGELILYGGLSGQPVAVSAMQLAARNLSVKGFWLGPWFANTSADEQARVMQRLLTLFQKRQLQIPVAGIYALEDFKAAIRHSLTPGRLGKILLRS